MKVLLDSQAFSMQRFGGVSRLFAEVYSRINNASTGIHVNLPDWFGENEYARLAGMPQRGPITRIDFKGRARLSWELNWRLARRELEANDWDLFHPTYYNPWFLRYLDGTPFVVTVHDMIHERYAKDDLTSRRKTTDHKRRLVSRARKVIAVSEATKTDLVTIFGTDPSKISVVHHASELPVVPERRQQWLNQVRDRRYILYVGSRRAYKNFSMFLRGVSSLLVDLDLYLVCVGGGRFSHSEIAELDRLGVRQRVDQISVDDSVLYWAYHEAELFVYPSIAEGFGIPILEAFEARCPVVASDIAVFHEVGGDAVVYFDATSTASITSEILRVVNDEDVKTRMKFLGAARSSVFSWDRTATDTADVYTSCLA